jgi:predicted DNA-binding protein (MmcQ/YjbR family)
MTQREQLYHHLKKKYNAAPEYLWARYPNYAVFRHADNQKWFCLVMDVKRETLGLSGDGIADILNVKVADPFLADLLVQQPGYLRGYHMSKENWISILLDGTVAFSDICGVLEESYLVTASSEKKQKLRPPKEWIVPANPKYYDVTGAFENAEEIDWKQGKGIRTGDTVFLYVAAPVSAILYRCIVTQTDIPFRYDDGNVHMTSLMKIRLQRKYPPEAFSFEVLKNSYGISAVRGPRGVPHRLSIALKKKMPSKN